MITRDQSSRDATLTSDEVIGKIFLALSQDSRQCLICDCVFSRQGAAEHAGAVCHPSDGNLQKRPRSDYANR